MGDSLFLFFGSDRKVGVPDGLSLPLPLSCRRWDMFVGGDFLSIMFMT